MRKGFSRELRAFKDQNAEILTRQINKYVKQKDQITVSFFDSLLGVDDETMAIINRRLDEVKVEANLKVAGLVKHCEELERKNRAYAQVDKGTRGILQYRLSDIVKSLPHICQDPQDLWDLLLETFGGDVFTPMIVRKFPAQFSGNLEDKHN